MPVTTRVAPVEVKLAPSLSDSNAIRLLQASCPNIWKDGASVLDSSFGAGITINAANNGFVSTVLDAYLQHNHLVLRPEDVWFAILIQFSFYVNLHSEKLRKYFVNHAGKKKLEIWQNFRDLPAFVLEMTELIAANVKDPSLREWIIPSFTTTTDSDRITAAIIMMGTMQKYFAYFNSILCGIPSVTLLGEKEDWQDILERIQFLAKFGEEHEDLLLWNSVLTSIASKFIRTFEAPDSPEIVHFWQRTVHQYRDDYSGEKNITGWILAFCFFDAEGNGLVVDHMKNWGLAKDWKDAVKKNGADYWLDGFRLGDLKWEDIPAGHSHVPVHINDMGMKYMAKAVAGSVGWEVKDSDKIFPETRRKSFKPTKQPKKSSDPSFLSIKKIKEPSDPSTFTNTTLVEHSKPQKPGLWQYFAQKVLCFKLDADGKEPEVKISPFTGLSAGKSKQSFKVHRPTYRLEDSKHVPQISDLVELSNPWQHEDGGKHDTIQPVTGWWVVKIPDSNGDYGKDPDVPDVIFQLR